MTRALLVLQLATIGVMWLALAGNQRDHDEWKRLHEQAVRQQGYTDALRDVCVEGLRASVR